MERSTVRITENPQEKVKVYIKSKNPSHTFVKELISDPVVEKKKMNEISDIRKAKGKSRAFLDTVAEYRFKKVFQPEEFKKDVIEWRSSVHKHPFLRKNVDKKSFMPAVFSICGAVIIGIVMGLSVLSLFFSDHKDRSQYAIDSHLPKVRAEHNRLIGSDVPLSPLRMVMLQGGIFSEKSRAQIVVDDFRSRGLVAEMSSEAPFHVYLGVAPNNKDASQLAMMYKKNKVDVYPRELNIGSTVTLSNDQRKVEQIIQDGNHLATELSNLSSQGIIASQVEVSDPQWMQLQQKLDQECRATLPYLSGQAKVAINKMNQSLAYATSSMHRAKREAGKEKDMLWKVQEGLVRYVTAYQQLLRVLSTG